MKRLALSAQALFALAFVSVLALIWYSMVTQGWMQGLQYFYVGNIFCDLYMFLVLNILLIPAVFVSSWSLVQGLGWLPLHEGARYSSKIFAFMGIGCFAIALYVIDPIQAVQGRSNPEPPSDAYLQFPSLPLPDDEEEQPWEFVRLDGGRVTMADFEGKAVFLNLWATWCGFCIFEFPNIQRLYDANRDNPDIAFIMMTNEDLATVKQWLATEEGSKYDFPIYLTEDIPTQYEPTGWPTTFFIAPDGRTAFRHSGMVAWDGENTRTFLRELAAAGK